MRTRVTLAIAVLCFFQHPENVRARTFLSESSLREITERSLAWWRGSASTSSKRLSEDAEADRVRALPGLDALDSSLFSGYVTVDKAAGRALFYAFVESERSPDQDPLVLWLNGGPGCSSLAGGFLSELGPYYPTARAGKLQRNPHAWTKVANIVFLESPAFVGWSYSNRTADAVVGDARTAADALRFLLGFLARFDSLRGRDFWIAGESYGGHYVPNLALEIARYNRASNGRDKINFKGFLVGNAWTDPATDNEGAVDFWYHHAIISATTAHTLKAACNFSHVGPLLAAGDASAAGVDPQACRATLEASGKGLSQINIYDIYVDTCQPKPRVDEIRQLAKTASGHPAVLGAHIASAPRKGGGGGGGAYDPCVDNEVELYFNRPDVQRAMHANQTGDRLPWPWTGCSPVVQYSQRDLFTSMLPKYDQLLKEGLRILIYSGDVDGIVPVTGTRRWIRQLGLDIEKPWRIWRSTTGQVAGRFVKHGERFTFATVRDAGHMVPYTQGERSYELFSRFVQNSALA